MAATVSEARKLILESEACARARDNSEDAEYACCAIADLALVMTERELIEWLNEYSPLVSQEMLDRVMGLKGAKAAS